MARTRSNSTTADAPAAHQCQWDLTTGRSMSKCASGKTIVRPGYQLVPRFPFTAIWDKPSSSQATPSNQCSAHVAICSHKQQIDPRHYPPRRINPSFMTCSSATQLRSSFNSGIRSVRIFYQPCSEPTGRGRHPSTSYPLRTNRAGCKSKTSLRYRQEPRRQWTTPCARPFTTRCTQLDTTVLL